jgi:hypothetical protein
MITAVAPAHVSRIDIVVVSGRLGVEVGVVAGVEAGD